MKKEMKLYAHRLDELKQAYKLENNKRIQIEEEFTHYKEQIQNIVDHMRDAYCILDANWKFTFVNEHFPVLMCISGVELIGKTVMEVFPDLTRELCSQEISTRVAAKSPLHFDFYHEAQNCWLEVNASAYRDTYSFCVRDITTRKQSEQSLKESEQQIANIINFLPDATLAIDTDGRVISWNKAAEDMTGIKAEEILGRNDFEYSLAFYGSRRPMLLDLVLTPEEKWVHSYPEIIRKGDLLEGENFCPMIGHEGAYLRATASPLFNTLGEITGAIECVRDMSDRRRAEEELAVSEEMYRRIVETANEGIWLIDADNITTFVNKRMADMLGYPVWDIVGRSILDFVDETGETLDQIHSKFRPGETVETYEFKYIRKNGEFLWTLTSLSPVFNKNGIFVGSMGMITDISERKKAEEALRASEEMYRRIVDTANEGIGITDENSQVVFVNKKLANMLGYNEPDQIIGRPLLDFVFEDDKAEFENSVQKRQYGIISENQCRYRRKDGSSLWTIVSIKPIYSTAGDYIGSLAMLIDNTERKMIEMEMARLDRLNLVGEIAAGIGHEIRNPMTSIRGFLQMLREKDSYQDDLEFFDIMIEELDRCNLIISEFLSLAKDRNVKLEYKNLNHIIRLLLPLINAEAAVQDKHIKTDLKDIPSLLLDERETRQLLLNLVRNGLEAMSAGGTLTIQTIVKNESVILGVYDQGTGVDKTIIEKLGTPFVTTKENGTGLGLPVCYSIAARHNAKIEIETSSRGTKFNIVFRVPTLTYHPGKDSLIY